MDQSDFCAADAENRTGSGYTSPAQKRYLTDVLEALPVAVYTTDATGTLTYCNQAAMHLAGRRPTLGSDEWCVSWRLYWPDGTPMRHDECPMAVALKEGRPVRGQRIIVERPDGSRFPVLPHPTPLFDVSGALIGAVNMLIDVSDRVGDETASARVTAALERQVVQGARTLAAAVDRLTDSERTFRLFMQHVADYAIFMLTADGCVATWNLGAERIKGYTRDEIVGQHFSRFYTEEARRAGVPARALETARTTGRFEEENWRVRKDGTRFWASVVINALRDESGIVVGFAKVTRDMTERRLIEEKLRQSQKMESIGQLTGGVAHDFNNLLTVILGNLEYLHRSLPTIAEVKPRMTRSVTSAMDAARRAADLTHRLLAFSRQQALQPKSVDANQLVQQTILLLRRTLGAEIQIKSSLASDLCRVFVDPHELDNALLNLSVNARDAMPDGGTLTIETADADGGTIVSRADGPANGRYVMITITDTGTGMDQETITRAFDPFFTTKEIGHGTGLGLSQVYGFVTQSGGHIAIESQLGCGTAIKIWLPVSDKESDEVAAREAAGENADVGGGSETVLVVEDDDAVRTFTTDMLRDLGYRVLEAPNGGAALEILDRQPQVHLLLTDMRLPGQVDGHELSVQARRDRPDLRVLFITGYAQDASIRAGRLDRGVSLLSKPFTLGELAAKVREILESYPSALPEATGDPFGRRPPGAAAGSSELEVYAHRRHQDRQQPAARRQRDH